LIGGAIQNNEKVITDTAKRLWEYFLSKKITDTSSDPTEVKTIVLTEKETPPHCRVQYYWNDQK
jgi:hypothetical protein